MRISQIEKRDKDLIVHVSKNKGSAVKGRILTKLWDMAADYEKVIITGEDTDPLDLENQRQTSTICFWISSDKTEVWTRYKLDELPVQSYTFDWIWRMGRLITPEKEYNRTELYALKRQYEITYDNYLGQAVWKKEGEN